MYLSSLKSFLFRFPVAVALAEAANDGKGVDILVLHVKPLIYWTRFFVIATAFSRPQLAAIKYVDNVFCIVKKIRFFSFYYFFHTFSVDRTLQMKGKQLENTVLYILLLFMMSSKRIRDVGEERFKVIPRGDTKPNPWTLLDYGM